MCVVSEEAAITPLCDTLIMTCQTGDMATPNSLKCNTRVWCQSLTHHLCLSHMDTNTQNRGPMTVLNTHTNNITAYTYTLFRTELHYCILAPNLLKIVCVKVLKRNLGHIKKVTREDVDASANTNTQTNYTQCSPGSSLDAGLYLGGGSSW